MFSKLEAIILKFVLPNIPNSIIGALIYNEIPIFKPKGYWKISPNAPFANYSLLRKGKSAEKRNSKAKIHSITITDSKFEP